MIIDEAEAATQLSRLIDSALAGDEVLIARAGQPLIRLVALDSTVVGDKTALRRAVLRMPLGELDGINVADEISRERAEETR